MEKVVVGFRYDLRESVDKNGIKIDKETFDKALQDYLERQMDGSYIGELGHNDPTKEISLNDISHEITNVKIKDKGVVEFDVNAFNTPTGRFLQSLISDGKLIEGYTVSPLMSVEWEHDVDENGEPTKTGHYNVKNIRSFDIIKTE